jgi:hypothetical protein
MIITDKTELSFDKMYKVKRAGKFTLASRIARYALLLASF